MDIAYNEQERLACEDYIFRCQRADALNTLQAINQIVQERSEEELVGLREFLKQEPYFDGMQLSRESLNSLYQDAQDNLTRSDEILIGALLGFMLGESVIPSNEFGRNWRALEEVEKPYRPDPNKFDNQLVSYRLCTYKAMQQASAQMSKIMTKLKTVPNHKKLKLSDVKELFKMVGLPSLEEINTKDTKLADKWRVSGKFSCAGFVGCLVVGGLAIAGLIPAFVIGDMIAGAWTFLMTVANRISQRIINNAADREANNTPTSLGYTPGNIAQLIQSTIAFKNAFAKEIRRIGVSEDGYLELDEHGEMMDEEEVERNYEKKEYEYYKLEKCIERIGYAINGMAITCVAIMKATNLK